MASPFWRRHAKKPSFFKVLIEDFTTRLKIPPAFIKEFEEVPTKTILETYYGKSEEVEVKKFGSKFYFHNGWEKFVEVNNLETGDFLVFEYFEDYCKFKVKIYGKSCCEKQSDMVNGKADKRNAQKGRKRKIGEEEEEEEESKSKAIERNIISIDSDSSSSESDDGEDEVGRIGEIKAETTKKSKRKRKHSILPPDYGDKIQFSSENPFFQLELKYSTANFYIYIPTDFLRKRMKEVINKRIKFQISQEVWDVKLLVPKRVLDTTHKEEARVTREWQKIAREYHLEIGDVCFFEMIKSDDFDDCCVFRIHVYRWDRKKEEFVKKFNY